MERFAADRMLGRLAKWLRVLGYDVVYLREGGDGEILALLQEDRILLTRNRRAEQWHKHGKVFSVRANDPKEQLREVVKGLCLQETDKLLFSRCLRCNRLLRGVDRAEVREEVPDYIWQTHQRFHRCDDCGKIYWFGSHSERMRLQLPEIFVGCD